MKLHILLPTVCGVAFGAGIMLGPQSEKPKPTVPPKRVYAGRPNLPKPAAAKTVAMNDGSDTKH